MATSKNEEGHQKFIPKGCRTCNFHLDDEDNPYARCLIYYNKSEAIERLKSGLIGKCEDYKPREDNAIEHED